MGSCLSIYARCADRLTAPQSWKGRLKRAYKVAYPWLNTSYEVWLLFYNIAYLFERTPYYRPWLSWVGVDLRRVSADDLVGVTCVDYGRS